MGRIVRIGGSRIDDMLNTATGRKSEILKELKKLNKSAYLVMTAPYTTFKVKYKLLQQSNEWKKAKWLLREYFTVNDALHCRKCGRMLYSSSFTIHHAKYSVSEIFTPDFIEILDNRCHKRIHLKKWSK